MLRAQRIGRHFEAEDHDALLRDLADNGLVMPLPLRVRLSQGPVPAMALGLRRLLELTYGPSPLSRRMTAALLAHQHDDGGFAPGDPLPTAAAAAALGLLLREQRAAAGEAVAQAHERALLALSALQAEDGLFHCEDDRDDADRSLTAAFVLFLLGRDERFRELVRVADLLNCLEEQARHLPASVRKLLQHASLQQPSGAKPQRGAATLAA